MTLVIEIAYATPEQQEIIKLTVADNLSIMEIIKLSSILEKHPELDPAALAVGVYGKRIYDVDKYIVKDKDRIEIYRPLLKSPNQKRLERVKTK